MSFISASGLPLDVSSLDVTGSAEVHGNFVCDQRFYQRDLNGGVCLEEDVVVGSARYDQLLGVPNSIKVFRTTNATSVATDRLIINQTGVTIPAGTLTMTDSQAVPITTINSRFVFGSGIYDENDNINNSFHVFRDTDGAGASTSSLNFSRTSATFTGVLSTGNTAVTLENTPATQTLTGNGADHGVFVSGVLPIGVYMVTTSCIFYKPAPYFTEASLTITNSASVVAMTSLIVQGVPAEMSEWGANVSLLWTSDGTNQFIVEVSATTGDGSDFTLQPGGRTQYIKIA